MILVTGATGFIGRQMCLYLNQIGYKIRGTFRGNAPPSDYPSDILWVNIGEIGPDTSWDQALEGVHYVIHLAGLAHQIGTKGNGILNEFLKINTKGTENLVKQISKHYTIRRFVFISSLSVYDHKNNETINELTLCNPVSDYGHSKYEAEKVIQDILKSTNTDWCIIRPSLVYGAGNPGNMERLQCLILRRLPLPFARIDNKRSFIFVGNLVDAISKCVFHPSASREIYLVSDGFDLSTKDLVTKIGSVIGRKVVLFSLPIVLLKIMGIIGDYLNKAIHVSLGVDTYSIEKLISSFTIDSSLIRNNLNWIPPFSIEEGLMAMFSKK